MTTPIIKIKVLPKPVLKGKMDVRFPSAVSVQSPILLDRTGGAYNFSLSVTALRTIFDSIYTSVPLPFASISGTISLAQIADNSLTNVKSAQMAANTVKGNATAGTANQTDIPFATLLSDPDFAYTQAETGAVASPMIRRLNNTLFASEFGAVGDNATNDYTALQNWLNAVASSHKEGRLDPGKKYFVSGADLTFTALINGGSYGLYGMGSMVRTDPTQNRIGLIVTWNFAGGTRVDASSITLIDGWTINQYQDANALMGMKFVGITGAGNLILRNNRFAAGGDGIGNFVNYTAMQFVQGTNTDPNTAIFWIEIENCRFKGGANTVPVGIWFVGGHNAISITKNNFSGVDLPIRFEAANRLGAVNANNGVISNGVKILDNSFEGILDGIKFLGISTISRSAGLQVQNNRIESITAGGSAFFNYGLDTFSEAPPVLGPNYLSSGDWGKYIFNPNALAIDVRDEYVGRATINPASLAAGATTTIGTITLAPSVTGDQVRIETNADLQGLIVTGYVSAANTVTIRLANPTTAAVDLPSMNFIARVRPQY